MKREAGLALSESLIPYSILPLSLINHAVSGDIMHREKKKFCIFIPVVKFLPNCHF